MKKILIVVLFILLTVPVFAADAPAVKGNFVVTLPLFSYWTGMGDFDETSNFSIFAMGYEPEIQYFVIDRLAIGGKLGYSSYEEGESETTTTCFGPLANYYFTIKAPVTPYAGAGLYYTKYDYGDSDRAETELRLLGGAVYMLGKYLSAYGEVFVSPYVKSSNGQSISGQKIGMSAGIKAFF